ncbi:MAG: nitrilase-related carbon-nitrogen hydrolase [Planctomycetota bacterium]
MSTLHVAGIQLDIAWENPAENFSRAMVLGKQAVQAGARLVVLPEMFATGFSMSAAQMAAHASEVVAFGAKASKELGAWLLAGFAVPGNGDGARPRNAAAVWNPRGEEVVRYHKIHPFTLAGEDKHYDGGNALPPTVTIDGVRVTPIICYDLRFPEIFRARASDTDLFCVIANWPEARRVHWSTLLRARAIESQVWVLGVNRVGEGNGLAYSGDSVLVDMWGEVYAERTRQAGVVGGVVDAGRVSEARTKYSFLADRRPAVYAG